jgi:DNA polymerase
MTEREDVAAIVRAVRAYIESDQLAGVDAAPLRLPAFRAAPGAGDTAGKPRRAASARRAPSARPATARRTPVEPSPSSGAAPPAWPYDGIRPSEDPGKMPFPLPDAAEAKLRRLLEIQKEMGDCARCKLCRDRTTLVFGVGNPDADLMFVGEGPGRDEDRSGEPFVGLAGQMLTRIIENVLGLKRRDVYIANVVKCRPPNNRTPEPDESRTCAPFLLRQIEIVGPRVVVALGGPAARTLLGVDGSVGRMRGKFHDALGTRVMPTYHPAYILRLEGQEERAGKLKVWDDMKKVRAELDADGA